MEYGNTALMSFLLRSPKAYSDADVLMNAEKQKYAGIRAFRLAVHVVLLMAGIIYMRGKTANMVVPWVLIATPLVTGWLTELTFFKKSLHLYALSGLIPVAVAVWALMVWKWQGVDYEVFYLNLIFFMLLAC
jgi:hypothetical protein